MNNRLTFANSFPIDLITKEDLDYWLAKGWFRMSKKFFTTSFIRFNDKIYNTIWLRLDLKNFEISETQKNLISRNKHFKIKYEKFKLNEETEELFQKYKEGLGFSVGHSLSSHLYDDYVYEKLSHCIKIYDGNLLIACGIYEKGIASMEGLICIYDPGYKKYSPGKYLMYLKIENAITKGYKYFYPGYYVPGYKQFDYKLSLSHQAMEYYHPSDDAWYKLIDYNGFNAELEEMINQIQFLSNLLHKSGIKHVKWFYPYFDLHLHYDFSQCDPFDYPYFIMLRDDATDTEDTYYIMVYDTRSKYYKLLYCFKYADVQDFNCPNYFYKESFIAVSYTVAEDVQADQLLKKLVFNNVM